MKILIIDDSPTMRLTARRAVNEATDNRYTVLEAQGGQEGLDIYNQEAPDLILLDVEMPNMGGIEFVRIIRELEQQQEFKWTPVIFVTSLDGEKSVEKCLEAGGDDFITKPLSSIIIGAKLKAFRRQIDLMRRLEDSLQEASNASVIDALTGVGNRRGFDKLLDIEWVRCNRANQPLSVISIDIDYFKRYNDTYGHPAGDKILRQVANTIVSAAGRAADSVYRIGGEEFTLLMPDTGLEGAHKVAGRVQEAIAEAAIFHSGGINGFVTVSMGVAGAGFGLEEPSEMIRRADHLLYQAKQYGRANYKVETY